MIVALVSPPSPIWFFARAAGFVTLMLLTASVALGVIVSMRGRSARWPLFISDELHRYLSTVFMVFLGLHVVTIWLDPFTHFSLAEVLVPFISSYRPLSMGLGIVAAELALALFLSAYARALIGYRAWRVIHFGTYAIFPLGFVHGVANGSDTGTTWGLAIYLACAAIVGALVCVRMAEAGRSARAPRRA